MRYLKILNLFAFTLLVFNTSAQSRFNDFLVLDNQDTIYGRFHTTNPQFAAISNNIILITEIGREEFRRMDVIALKYGNQHFVSRTLKIKNRVLPPRFFLLVDGGAINILLDVRDTEDMILELENKRLIHFNKKSFHETILPHLLQQPAFAERFAKAEIKFPANRTQRIALIIDLVKFYNRVVEKK